MFVTDDDYVNIEKPEPTFLTNRGALYRADCIDVLTWIRSESIDCIFADPPFNLGKEYRNGFTDARDEVTYIEWCYEWLDECSRVLVPGGALFVYALPKLAMQFGSYLADRLSFRHWIALTMKGTYPRGQRLYPAHYALLYFTKGTPRVFNRVRVPIPTCRHCGGDLKDYGGHRKYLNPEGINLTDFWEDTSPNRHRSSKARPGINELKPMIPERAIRIATNAGDLVLDPFGGGGTSYQAAERLDRYWIGSEIGDCSAIIERLNTTAETVPSMTVAERIQDAFVDRLGDQPRA